MKRPKDTFLEKLLALLLNWDPERITDEVALEMIKRIEIYLVSRSVYIQNVLFVDSSLHSGWKSLLLDLCSNHNIIYCEHTPVKSSPQGDMLSRFNLENKSFGFNSSSKKFAASKLFDLLTAISNSDIPVPPTFKNVDELFTFFITRQSEYFCTSGDIMKRVLFTDAHLEKLKSLVLGLNENQSLTIIHSYQLPLKREGNYDEKNFRQTKINALLTLFRGFFDRRKEFTNLIEAAESKEREKSLEELIKKAQEDFWPCDYNIPFLFKKIDDINISTRMKNIVRSANIKTLLELAQISEERFKEFRTCGDAIVREAKEVLGSHGLMFGMKFDPELVALVHQSLK